MHGPDARATKGMLDSPAILIGGIFALIELVVAALLDFFKREARFRYDVYSRAESHKQFLIFLGLTLGEWVMVGLVQVGILDPLLGWPIFLLCFGSKMVLIQQDFIRRRIDVPNKMYRVCQWTFMCTAVALVLVSYYVHSRPKPGGTTAPVAERA